MRAGHVAWEFGDLGPPASLSFVVGRKIREVDARGFEPHSCSMKGEFTAIIEEAPEGGYWAICPEVPGANGQGETVEETKASLREAIRLILEDRLEDVRRGLPSDAIQTVIVV
jgi:predicted RNase H-like HicB family nuclease